MTRLQQRYDYQDLSGKMFIAETDNVREAVELVKAGKAKRYEDPKQQVQDALLNNLLQLMLSALAFRFLRQPSRPQCAEAGGKQTDRNAGKPRLRSVTTAAERCRRT